MAQKKKKKKYSKFEIENKKKELGIKIAQTFKLLKEYKTIIKQW